MAPVVPLMERPELLDGDGIAKLLLEGGDLFPVVARFAHAVEGLDARPTIVAGGSGAPKTGWGGKAAPSSRPLPRANPPSAAGSRRCGLHRRSGGRRGSSRPARRRRHSDSVRVRSRTARSRRDSPPRTPGDRRARTRSGARRTTCTHGPRRGTCPRAWTDGVLSNASPILDRGATRPEALSAAERLLFGSPGFIPASPRDQRKTRSEDAFKMPTGFFVGNELDLATRKPRGRLELDPTDLLTHQLIVGVTGSRKTGLAIVLIEEA